MSYLSILFPKRFELLKYFGLTYLVCAFIVRMLLYVISFSHFDFSLLHFIQIFSLGFLFDLGALSYILAVYAIYLLVFPLKFYGSKLDKILTKVSYALFLFFLIFGFLAEIPFWLEYQRRFNFIAVDYLLYTYEVVENIHQTFSLPLLIGTIILLTILGIRFAKKKGAYHKTFTSNTRFISKIFPTLFWLLTVGVFHLFINNTQAEIFTNISENELTKSGIYSFFAAYQSNELNFNEFYPILSENEAFSQVKKSIQSSNSQFNSLTLKSIQRAVTNTGTEQKPNVIFIGLESLNARFMERFGNTENWTPTLDSLIKESVFFSNIYATGTRTIRGLEAISLAIPPTPGRSIVKRDGNKNLFTIGEVFKQKGYSRTFLVGGDGHFDNMTNFFSHNGFDIVDRKKKHRLDQELPTKRTRIEDNEVSFENAWATCDEDLYAKLLSYADEQHNSKQPFFNLVMTSSNHQPYTYPKGVVDEKDKGTRAGAVKYSDKALQQFLKKAKSKPWFENTVFVIMADHCAYSAGRTELDVENHHIPALILNLKHHENVEVQKLSSQIDIFPTLFGYLNWSYTSNLFGKDITKMTPSDERAFIGNHRKVGLLKKDGLLVLETQKKHSFYQWSKKNNTLILADSNPHFLKETISYYQTAYELFKNGGLKLK